MGLAALIVLWGVGKYLMAWLLKKYTADDEKYQVLTWFAEIFLRLIIIPLKAWNGLLQLLKHTDSAVPIYSGILCWGRRSGFPPVPSETPIEYGLKLSHHFPELKEEIEVIIQTFNMEIYGNIEIDERLLSRIRSAQRKMRSPRYWPLRLKGLFVHRPL